MPIARPCSFCGNEIEPGTTRMFVRRDGTTLFFCSSKCQKNLLKLRRVPREVKWTLTYAAARGKAAAPTGVAVVTAVGEEAEVSLDFTILLPKGKNIPPAVHDLIDRRFGPELGTAAVEKHFVKFSAAPALKHAVALWYGKKHKGKFEEVPVADYVSFLDTAHAKKILKDWLDAEAKRGKA